MILILLYSLGASVALVVVGGVVHVTRLRRREKRDALRLKEAVQKGTNKPASLYPIIDPNRCSGCLSCLDVCPEGDLFGVQEGKAMLVEGSKCIGHGICVDSCPTGAIRLVFGTEERGVDLPELDSQFESAREGVYVVGELGGMGLIRNAIKQGLDVAQNLAARIRRAPPLPAGQVDKDVAIIGAGPAGIATAIGCRALGLSYRIIDQSTLGGTINAYPKQKLVMVQPIQLPLYGELGGDLSKQQILDALASVVDKGGVEVHEGVRALDIRGEEDDFQVVTSEGAFRARRVVLAIGRRGLPRKLGVPGEDSPNITYTLKDPEQYAGARVLVVGGGDSAVECANMLAEYGAAVTISYRGEAFSRCRAVNRAKLEELERENKIRPLYQSEVLSFEPGSAVIRLEDGRKASTKMDYAIINIGGELPSKFLEEIGVSVQKHFGKAEEALDIEDPEVTAGRNRVAWGLYGASMLSLLAFGWLSYDYIMLTEDLRKGAPFHAYLAPEGVVGHTLGIVATLMMFTNFLYSLRKRYGWFKRWSIRTWMMLHTFTGLVGGAFALYHSTLQFRDPIGTVTMLVVGFVCLTGLAGRYLLLLVPVEQGKMQSVNELKHRQTVIAMDLNYLAGQSAEPSKTVMLAQHATQIAGTQGSLLQYILKLPGEYMKYRRALRDMRSGFRTREEMERFRRRYRQAIKTTFQLAFYRPFRKAFGVWRVGHIVLAGVFVLTVLAHIVWTLMIRVDFGDWAEALSSENLQIFLKAVIERFKALIPR